MAAARRSCGRRSPFDPNLPGHARRPGPSSTHLLGCGDAHQTETAPDDLRDSHRQFQPCPRKLWIFLEEKTALRVVVPAIPQRMELRREVVEIECDPVRLMRQCGPLQH